MFKEVYHIKTPYKDVIEIIVFRELEIVTVTTNRKITLFTINTIHKKLNSIKGIDLFSIQILNTFA